MAELADFGVAPSTPLNQVFPMLYSLALISPVPGNKICAMVRGLDSGAGPCVNFRFNYPRHIGALIRGSQGQMNPTNG